MNIHIIGLAGSGKTSLARAISAAHGIPAIDLDYEVYGPTGERPENELKARLNGILSREGWVTEGAYHEPWLDSLLSAADPIIWLDVPLRTCLFRIVKRHVVAELARNNPHPGWRKLARFLNYTRLTAPAQRQETRQILVAHKAKVIHCRSSKDAESALMNLTR